MCLRPGRAGTCHEQAPFPCSYELSPITIAPPLPLTPPETQWPPQQSPTPPPSPPIDTHNLPQPPPHTRFPPPLFPAWLLPVLNFVYSHRVVWGRQWRIQPAHITWWTLLPYGRRQWKKSAWYHTHMFGNRAQLMPYVAPGERGDSIWKYQGCLSEIFVLTPKRY